MKTAKKLFAALLAVIMVMALMTVPALASGGSTPSGSITITNPTAGTVYKVYRIFDLESYRAPDKTVTGDKGAYLYKVNASWANFINSNDIKDIYVQVDANDYVTWVGAQTDARVAEFAQKALAYATADATKIDAVATQTASDSLAENATVEFTGLDLGYYLVDSSLGALCALTTTDPTAEVTEKNEAPSVDKTITDTTLPGVGDKVNYQVKITVQKGAENYVLTDKMSEGLTFDTNSIKVQVNNQDVAADKYETITTATPDYTFKITFDNTYVASLAANTDIIVTYSATINTDAVEKGANNTAKLNYGNKEGESHTTTSSVEPTLVSLTINKVDGASKQEADNTVTYSTYLGGAEFVLSKTVDSTTKYATVVDGVLTDWVDSENQATKLVTSSEDANKGKVTVKGLAAGTYSLTETKAPDGYNKLEDPQTVTITVTDENGGTATINGNNVIVENNAGAVLPSTGGIGTTIFYVVGGVLVLAAIVLLVTRKRMNEE